MDPKTIKTIRQLLQEEIFALEKRLDKKFATKDDLKSFATKDDLKSFATKDDLKSFATKDDLLKMKDELISEIGKAKEDVTNDLSDVIKQVVGSIDENKATKDDIRALDHRVSRLERHIA